MKHSSLLTIFILAGFYLQAQKKFIITDTSYIIGIVNTETDARESESHYRTKTIQKGSYVLVYGALRDTRGYKIMYREKKYIIPTGNLNINYIDLYNQLLEESPENLRTLDSVTTSMAPIAHQYEIKKALAYINKLRSKGLAVIDYRAYDESEYTDGTGIRVKVLNLSKKTIKYISFNVTGINAVDDAVSSKSRKGIGPIKPDETGSYEFEYAWFTDIIEYIRINSIIIQYMDGSKRTVTGINQLVLPESITDILYDND